MSEIHGWTHSPNGSDSIDGPLEIVLFPDRNSPAALLFPELAIVTVGDGVFVWLVLDRALSGSYLREVEAGVSVAGAVTLQLHKLDTSGAEIDDMLTTPVTIDGGERTSQTAATRPVIDLDNAQILLGEAVRFDVDAADGTAEGLKVFLSFGPRLAITP